MTSRSALARNALGCRRRTLAALLLLASLFTALVGDIHDLYWYVDFMSSIAVRFAPDHVDAPHFQYHTLMPPTGLAVVVVILATAVALGPYRRGERWARWALTLATLAYLAVKVWDSVTLYPHPLSIIVMAALAALGMAASCAGVAQDAAAVRGWRRGWGRGPGS